MDTQVDEIGSAADAGGAADSGSYSGCTAAEPPFPGEPSRLLPVSSSRGPSPARQVRVASPAGARHGRVSELPERELLRDLAGSLAGELNNLLTVINGRGALLAEASDLPPVARLGITDLLHASCRATDLVRRLMGAAGTSRLYPETLRIDGWLRALAPELESVLGPGIRVDLRLDDRAGLARVDPSELRAALRELARNARDAMPRGGRFSVGACRVFHAASRSSGMQPEGAAEYVRVTVSDTGDGIPDEIRGRIFDPLFSTRKHEGRAGLGLAAVDQFPRRSGGELSVYSLPGEGTTFSLLLPSA